LSYLFPDILIRKTVNKNNNEVKHIQKRKEGKEGMKEQRERGEKREWRKRGRNLFVWFFFLLYSRLNSGPCAC
jgi:hypothetical protein